MTGGGEQIITIDTYSPVSWFEVTVRNKTSGEIYLRDGFGTGKGYTEYLNRTLKVLKRDDMQIEFAGNNITATAMVWVKPESNIDDTSKFNLSTDCAYIDPNPRRFFQVGSHNTTIDVNLNNLVYQKIIFFRFYNRVTHWFFDLHVLPSGYKR